MNYHEGLIKLSNREVSRYILTGDDQYLKSRFIQAVRVEYKESNIFIFYPDMVQEACQILGSSSLFGDRVVILRNVDSMDDSIDPFLFNEEGILILEVEEGANLRTRRLSRIVSSGYHIQAIKMKEYGDEYPAWIRKYLLRKGFSIEFGVDNKIFNYVGSDLFIISNELDKVMLYASEEKTVDESMVNKVVSRRVKGTVFNILEALIRRDMRGAFSALESYCCASGTFIELVSFLMNYFEKFFRIVVLFSQGFSAEDISTDTGINLYILKTKYLSRVSMLGQAFIISQYEKLCDLDIELRLFKGDKKILIENFILGFVP